MATKAQKSPDEPLPLAPAQHLDQSGRVGGRGDLVDQRPQRAGSHRLDRVHVEERRIQIADAAGVWAHVGPLGPALGARVNQLLENGPYVGFRVVAQRPEPAVLRTVLRDLRSGQPLAREHATRLALAGLNGTVARSWQATALDSMFDIHPTIDDALTNLPTT